MNILRGAWGIFNKMVVFVGTLPVYFYRGMISPFLGNCAFAPSCSTYMLISVKRFGVFRGYVMGMNRLARCRPWGRNNGGYDPVPYGYSGGVKWIV